MKELRENLDIKILKADKGNATVIMDTVEYDSKVNCLLGNDATYTKLSVKSNPINRVTSNVSKYVWNLYKFNKISKNFIIF